MKYKDVPFGKIPINWGVARISEVTELVTDYVANGSFSSLAKNVKYKDEEDVGVLIRLVDYNNDFKGNFVFIDEHAYQFLGKTKLHGGEIIISNVGANVGTVFRCPYLPYKMSLAPNSIMVRFKENDDFYYFWLKSRAGQHMLHSIVTGSAQPKFNKTNFRKMLVPVPPKDQQNKIVSILQPLEKKIEENKKINKNLEEQAWSVFSKYYDAAESQSKFTALIDVLGGGTPKTNTPDFWNGSIPFFTPKDVGMPYTFHTEKHLTKAGLEHCNSKLYPKNTTFVTARGTVGKISLAGIPMAMNQSCYALISKKINPILVYFYVHKAVNSLKHKASGAVFDAIVTRDFDTETLNVLDKNDSRTVLSVIEPIMGAIHTNSENNIYLSNLKNYLIPKLMSGDIDVSNIDL